jgi:hypothetical protein
MYLPYDQIKDALKQQLEQNKRVEVFAKEIDDLKKEYAVEVNEDYFAPAEMPQQQAALQQNNIQPTAKQEVVEKRVA